MIPSSPAKNELVFFIHGSVSVVVNHQERVVLCVAAKLLQPRLHLFHRPVHRDVELGHFVPITLKGLAEADGFVLEGHVVGRRRSRVVLGPEIMKFPRDDQTANLLILGTEFPAYIG